LLIHKKVKNKTVNLSDNPFEHPVALTDIAIVGMALRVPGADDLATFWANLQAGLSSITRFTDAQLREQGVSDADLTDVRYVKAKGVLSDVALFDAAQFGLNPREAALLDPQHRLFLECAQAALAHAGGLPVEGDVGVFAGAATSLYLLNNLLGNPDVMQTSSGFDVMLGNSGDALPTRTSYALNLKGPSVCVQTACSTSLVAVHLAVQALINGECAVAMAGGVSIDLPQVRGYWAQEGMILSPDGHCRPFDSQANGTVPGSGVGVVVLKRLDDALAAGDVVHAVIKGSAINNDGHDKVGFTAPSTSGQAAVIAAALAVADVPADSIGYVETHGTGTALGDPIEVAALAQALGGEGPPCSLGSVKSNLGHLNTAAGVIGLIKATLVVRDALLVPTLHFLQANARLNLAHTRFEVPTQTRAWRAPLRRAGVSSFGMGGTNAHVVLQQAPPHPFVARMPATAPTNNRQRHWIEPAPQRVSIPNTPAAAADPLAMPPRTPDMADWFYTPSWREVPYDARKPADPGPLLLLADSHGLCRALAERLERQNRPVVLAFPGEHYARLANGSYTLRPAERADYVRLLDELAEQNRLPTQVVHGFTLNSNTPELIASHAYKYWLKDTFDLGMNALLALVQALGSRPERFDLLVTLSHALEVLDDARLQPAHATLLGAAKIVSQEYDRIACRVADVGSADDPAALEAVWQELQCSGPDVVVCRGGRRWVEDYLPTRLVSQDTQSVLRSGGCYLVTGGLGGMGLAFAQALADQVQARLILVGRSHFPERGTWDAALAFTDPASDNTRRAIAAIRRMEAAGAQVLVCQADVAEMAQMEAVLAQARTYFGAGHGAIRGVLHAAGIADYEGLIHNRSASQTLQTVRAKVHGTVVLDAVSAKEPLDFFLMCSSLGTALYHVKFGQVGYAAANEFQDQYARYRRAGGAPGSTLTINWSDWRESGMSVAALQRWAMRQRIENATPDAAGLSDAEGAAAMLRALHHSAPRIAICQHDLQVLIAQDAVRAKSLIGDALSPVARPNNAAAATAPRDAVERGIAEIWRKLLGVQQIGIEDDFYELGGHSLLATQVVVRVNDVFALHVGLDDFLDTPTVASLAALVRAAQANLGQTTSQPALTAITPRPAGPPPLSFAQERLWFAQQMGANPRVYNIPVSLQLTGAIDTDALTRALTTVVQRHESLRTLFGQVNGSNCQWVQDASRFSLKISSVTADQALQLRAEETLTAFDLTTDLPFRVHLLRLSDKEHVLLLTQHHVASDGWSLGVLTRELSALYTAYSRNQPNPLAPLAVQYADYAVWQRQTLTPDHLQAELVWWRERLTGLPDLCLPTDWPAPAQPTGNGDLFTLALPPALCASVSTFAKTENASDFMVFLASYQALLHEASGQEDFGVGTPIANRPRAQLEPLIGYFANTLVFRANLSGQPSFRQLVQRVREQANQAYAHQDIPFEKLVNGLGAAGRSDRNPLFQTLFVLQNTPLAPLDLPGMAIEALPIDNQTAKFDLTLSLVPNGTALSAVFEYSTDLFAQATVARLAQRFVALLGNLLTQPDLALHTLGQEPSMPAEARQLPSSLDGEPIPLPSAIGATQTDWEHQLHALWLELLSVTEIDLNDNFFELGGHSILLLELRGRICELTQADLPMVTLFRLPTIRRLAQFLAQGEGQLAPDAEPITQSVGLRQSALAQQQRRRAATGL
jgi:acyl transferase domain-containing protein